MGFTTAAVVGGAAMLGSSIVGAVQAGNERDKARAAMADALNEIRSVGAPPDLSKEIILNKFEQAGLLTPELQQKIELGVSKVAQIAENEKLKDVQMKALEQIKRRAEGGLTPEDRAALNQAQIEIQQQNQATQKTILQSMAQRGMGGAGTELASRLAASQASANIGAQRADEIGALASQRALQAAMQSGQFAGDIAREEFARAQTRSSAEDEVARFNIANAIARQRENVQSKNVAQEYNVKRAQHIADLNVEQANRELYRQAEAKRQHWLDQLDLARAKADMSQQSANLASQNAQAIGSQWGNIASGFGTIATGAIGAMGRQPASRDNYLEDDNYGSWKPYTRA